MEAIIALIERQEWGYSFERYRHRADCSAYVHVRDGECHSGHGDTPRAALAAAYAKAMQAQLASLGVVGSAPALRLVSTPTLAQEG